jgi:hypothetical protein
VMMTIEIPVAMSPYSIEVAALSLAQNCLSRDFTLAIPSKKNLGWNDMFPAEGRDRFPNVSQFPSRPAPCHGPIAKH